MHRHIFLDYDFDKIIKADYNDTAISCIDYQKIELTDVHEKNGGFPDSYVFENTKIYQYWWSPDDLDFDEFGRQLGMEVITVSSILQRPGCVIPCHRDTFFKIKKEFPERANEVIVRANIYLQDWKLGHLLQYEESPDEWKCDINWKQGEGHMWDEPVLHIGANAGFEDKYTLQISGFLLD